MINKLLIKFFNRCIVTLEPKPNVITETHRYYSDEVMDKAVNTYIKEKVKIGRGVGETHPLSNFDNPYAAFEISLRNASHIITKIWKWKGEYKAIIRLMPGISSGGALKKALLNYPNTIAFKLRGVGTTHPSQALDGSCDVINDDLRIISWDASPTGGKND